MIFGIVSMVDLILFFYVLSLIVSFYNKLLETHQLFTFSKSTLEILKKNLKYEKTQVLSGILLHPKNYHNGLI